MPAKTTTTTTKETRKYTLADLLAITTYFLYLIGIGFVAWRIATHPFSRFVDLKLCVYNYPIPTRNFWVCPTQHKQIRF